MQEAESTHSIQLYPAPSRNINKYCEKLLFREKVVRTESRKAKTMLEAWQKCSKKTFLWNNFHLEIHLWHYNRPLLQRYIFFLIFGSDTMESKNVSLDFIWDLLELTKYGLVLVNWSGISPDLYYMYERRRELWFYVEMKLQKRQNSKEPTKK